MPSFPRKDTWRCICFLCWSSSLLSLDCLILDISREKLFRIFYFSCSFIQLLHLPGLIFSSFLIPFFFPISCSFSSVISKLERRLLHDCYVFIVLLLYKEKKCGLSTCEAFRQEREIFFLFKRWKVCCPDDAVDSLLCVLVVNKRTHIRNILLSTL